jgi:uncharacterized membrane protein YkoI
MLKSILYASVLVLSSNVALALPSPAPAKWTDQALFRVEYGQSDYGDIEPQISPSDAADIAANRFPGYKVIKVKYLKSGVYAVTLKADGLVERVLVRASDGAIQ